MDNRVMMITTTQRQIEREAEKDLDAAQAAMEHASAHREQVRLDGGVDSEMYAAADRTFDHAWSTLAAASENLEKTCLEEEN